MIPVRQARPRESLTITPTSTPSRRPSSERSDAADPSGSAGSSAISSRATLEASTPAPAMTTPCRLATIRSSPRRATTRTVSSSIAFCRRASRAIGSSPPTATNRPSALETILDVTTTTSPSASHGIRAASSAPRSSPGRTSPIPVTGMTWTTPADGSCHPVARRSHPPLTTPALCWSARPFGGAAKHHLDQQSARIWPAVTAAPGRRRPEPWPRSRRRRACRAGSGDLDAGHDDLVGLVHQPGVEQAAGQPGAVVLGHGLGAHLDPDPLQAGVGHAAHRAPRR